MNMKLLLVVTTPSIYQVKLEVSLTCQLKPVQMNRCSQILVLAYIHYSHFSTSNGLLRQALCCYQITTSRELVYYLFFTLLLLILIQSFLDIKLFTPEIAYIFQNLRLVWTFLLCGSFFFLRLQKFMYCTPT